MKKWFPWLYSRKYLSFQIFIETIIFYLINYKLFNINFSSYHVHIIYLFWITFSYILGRYDISEKNLILLFLKTVIKLTILYLILYPLVSLIFSANNQDINSGFQNVNEYISAFIIYIGFYQLLNICLISFFRKKRKIWIFVGELEKYKECLKIINEPTIDNSLKNNFELRYYELRDDYSYKNVDGIILEDKKFLNQKFSINYFKNLDVELYTLLEWSEIILQRYPVDLFLNREGELLNIKNDIKPIEQRIKRVAETIIAIFLILITAPMIILMGIIIFLEDQGPIFYSQERMGLHGKSFKIIKLRTMHINAESGEPKWSTKNDRRITKIGSLLRNLRIDELPQLFSVIIGDMSLIGPRPERSEINHKLEKIIPFYNERHKIKPGISGWAQVNYPYGASIEDSKTKLSFDLYYLKNYSIFFDILIFIKTLRLVLNAKGAISTIK